MQRVAEFLNLQDLDLVSLQHEFGIYGGKAGSHILTLLRNSKVPVVTTLHTILTDPNTEQRAVMNELIRLSTRLVVMSQRAVDFLEEIYQVPPEKIDLIHHGIPDVPFTEPDLSKSRFGLEGNHVLLTFGLLSPNKGLEYAIRAMPAILGTIPEHDLCDPWRYAPARSRGAWRGRSKVFEKDPPATCTSRSMSALRTASSAWKN